MRSLSVRCEREEGKAAAQWMGCHNEDGCERFCVWPASLYTSAVGTQRFSLSGICLE